jgi:nucleoside-diphosphate-sugar epimerase
MVAMTHLLAFGLGYSATELASRLAQKGWRISATSRSEAAADAGRVLGYDMHVFNGDAPSPSVGAALQTVTHVLLSAPPDADGDPVFNCHAPDLAAAPNLRWVGYLSTIGVYGNHDGGWVDETTPATPASERSRRRVVAENQWLGFGASTKKTVQCFRLAGIYGPGRGAIDNIRDGTARRVIKPGQVFNRIHVADIATVLEAAISGIGHYSIYNVTDDEPAPPQDVITFAATLLGVPPPPELTIEAAALTPMGASFFSENKRVRNERIKADLAVALQYPSYREGLAAMLTT